MTRYAFVTERASAVSCESQGPPARAEANQSRVGSAKNEGQKGEGAACGREGCRMVSVGGRVTFSPQPSSEVSVFQDCQLSWGTWGRSKTEFEPRNRGGCCTLSGLGIFHLDF